MSDEQDLYRGGMGAMHQRWSPRIPTVAAVRIRTPGRGLVRGWVKDTSGEGMFIDTQGHDLALHRFVQVEFDAGTNRRVVAPAVVVRTDGKGVGVMFPACDAALFNAIVTLVTSPPVEDPGQDKAAG